MDSTLEPGIYPTVTTDTGGSSTINMSTFYPKIGAHTTTILKNLTHANDHSELIHITGTTKLHGTHADILIHPDHTITFQSRNRTVTSNSRETDNLDFVKTVKPFSASILKLAEQYRERYWRLNPQQRIDPNSPLIIAGEWIGEKIFTGVAIASLSRRFVIVSVQINGTWQPDMDYADLEDEDALIYNISRGGFWHETLDRNNIEESKNRIRKLTAEVGKKCPFAASLGICGGGEGIVWKVDGKSGSADFWFKSKDERFQETSMPKVKKVKDAEAHERAAKLAEALVTEARLEHGWFEMAVTDTRATGTYIQWVQKDVLAEEKDLITSSGVDEPAVVKEIQRRARAWYRRKLGFLD